MAEPGPQPRELRHLAPGDAHQVGQRPTYSSEARQRARADGKGLETLWRALSGWARKGSEWAVETLLNQIRTLRDKEFWDTYMSRLDELRNKKEREAEVGGLLGWMELKAGN